MAQPAAVLNVTKEDVAFMKETLRGALAQCKDKVAAAAGPESSGNTLEALEKICDAVCGNLQQLAYANKPGSASASAANDQQGSVSIRGGDIFELHRQVNDAVHRVDALRSSMPSLIKAAVTKQLEEMRPVADAVAAGVNDLQQLPDAHADGGMMATTTGQPAAEELQAMLEETFRRLPALRARMDHTVQRLSRILGALQSEEARPSPKTVERVLMNRLASDELDDGREDDLGVEDAGKALTRRRLAQDLHAPN